MRKTLLVSGLVLLALVGAAGGYYGGETYAGPSRVNEVGAAQPLTGRSVDPPLPKKTPVPSPLAPLTASSLKFHTVSFTIRDQSGAPLRLSIRVPRGWTLTRNEKAPQEVRFLDPQRERAVRVESALRPANQSTTDWMNQLGPNLKASQAYENDLQILSQGDGEVEANGETRKVSTLIYTYIPTTTLRYVIVRWVATGGDDTATVEMSITGLAKDAAGLKSVLLEASQSVGETG